MSDDFEDHCWKDVIPADILEVYAHYHRKISIGPNPALLAIDLYEVVYAGGPLPPAQLAKTHPNSCGEYAHAAIEPTKRLFAAARAAGLPIFYSTGDTRTESRPNFVTATKRNRPPVKASDYAIRPEFKPQPGDVVITKQRASVFFGTPLIAHLTQLGVQTLIVCGGHVGLRARHRSCLFARFQVVLVEDASIAASRPQGQSVDMHHKYPTWCMSTGDRASWVRSAEGGLVPDLNSTELQQAR